METEEPVCRICLLKTTEEVVSDPIQAALISPCHCKGSLLYVHRACLNVWRAKGPPAEQHRCGMCRFEYEFENLKTRHSGAVREFWRRVALQCAVGAVAAMVLVALGAHIAIYYEWVSFLAVTDRKHLLEPGSQLEWRDRVAVGSTVCFAAFGAFGIVYAICSLLRRECDPRIHAQPADPCAVRAVVFDNRRYHYYYRQYGRCDASYSSDADCCRHSRIDCFHCRSGGCGGGGGSGKGDNAGCVLFLVVIGIVVASVLLVGWLGCLMDEFDRAHRQASVDSQPVRDQSRTKSHRK